MNLEILNKTSLPLKRKKFELLFKKAFKVLGVKDVGEVSLSFVSEAEIKKLNSSHRGINKVTDVLSFSYLEAEPIPGDNHVGEIFICAQRAKEQAENGFYNELEFLFVHGLLHVFGFTHDTDEEESLMNETAQMILN